ncbi:hypothetical protein [Pseudomonas chlororaphis]|uniref:hypothetical protein n=1 Tax=Pseudomonas chlororaphis TaxID=587753 RepID=UPI003BF86A34
MQTLQQAGACYIMVWLLPDIGLTPAINGSPLQGFTSSSVPNSIRQLGAAQQSGALRRVHQLPGGQGQRPDLQRAWLLWRRLQAAELELSPWAATTSPTIPEKVNAYASSGGNLAYSTFSPYYYSGAFYYGLPIAGRA